MPKQTKYKVTIDIMGKEHKSEGKTLLEALDGFKLKWTEIKTRGYLKVTKGNLEYEKMMFPPQLRRVIMNKIARSVLASYSYDDDPEDSSIKNNFRQCIELIARFPTMIAYAYHAKAHYYNGKSLFLHNPKKGLTTAENFLRLIRPHSSYTKLEAEILDLCLVHMLNMGVEIILHLLLMLFLLLIQMHILLYHQQ